MRKFVLFLTSASLIITGVAMVEGQPGGGKGKGGGGQQSAVNLFNNADVKKALEITDEQAAKLPAEVMVAISKVLDEKQFKRFKQIDLQQRGTNAFTDKTVQKQLKMTDDQVKNITTLIDNSNKEIAELFPKGGKGGDFKGAFEKIAAARKEAKEKILESLTKDQRAAYRDMVGEEFKFTPFGGGGKKGDPKKKDAE